MKVTIIYSTQQYSKLFMGVGKYRFAVVDRLKNPTKMKYALRQRVECNSVCCEAADRPLDWFGSGPKNPRWRPIQISTSRSGPSVAV